MSEFLTDKIVMWSTISALYKLIHIIKDRFWWAQYPDNTVILLSLDMKHVFNFYTKIL